VPYLSALEVCSRRGAIQIHGYLTLPYLTCYINFSEVVTCRASEANICSKQETKRRSYTNCLNNVSCLLQMFASCAVLTLAEKPCDAVSNIYKCHLYVKSRKYLPTVSLQYCHHLTLSQCFSIFSERELLANVNSRSRSLYVIVRPSVCRLSVTFVCPTQAIKIFGNVSTPFGTLAIC